MTIPTRTCVACRRTAGKPELLRLVVGERAVQVDLTARHAGRGAYLCGRGACLDAALRRDGALIRRALRIGDRGVTLDADALRGQVGAAGQETVAAGAVHDAAKEHSGAVPLGSGRS